MRQGNIDVGKKKWSNKLKQQDLKEEEKNLAQKRLDKWVDREQKLLSLQK